MKLSIQDVEDILKLPTIKFTRKITDITGKRFDKLIAIKPIRIHNILKWLCKCDCGNYCLNRFNNLKNNKQKHSCGCYNTEFIKEYNKKSCNKNIKSRLASKCHYSLIAWNYEKNQGITPHDISPNNDTTKFWFICEKCKFVYLKTCYDFSHGKRCPICDKSVRQLVSNANDLQTSFPDIVKDWDYEKNKNVKPNEILPKCRYRAWWVCHKCKYQWQTSVNHRTRPSMCPKCKKLLQLNSFGEIQIIKFLDKNNIIYEIEKTFNKCKYQRKLRFDFYLPKSNLCIEYRRQEHYQSRKLQQSDNIKRDFCKKQKIRLLEIKYTDINIIDKILTNEIIEK